MSTSHVQTFDQSNRSLMQLLIDLRLSYSVISTGLVLVGFFWNNLEGFTLNYIALIVGVFLANVFIFIINDAGHISLLSYSVVFAL